MPSRNHPWLPETSSPAVRQQFDFLQNPALRLCEQARSRSSEEQLLQAHCVQHTGQQQCSKLVWCDESLLSLDDLCQQLKNCSAQLTHTVMYLTAAVVSSWCAYASRFAEDTSPGGNHRCSNQTEVESFLKTDLEIGHGPVAEVYRVVGVCLDCTRVTSNSPIKVSSLESFICLGFATLCLRQICWTPVAT